MDGSLIELNLHVININTSKDNNILYYLNNYFKHQ